MMANVERDSPSEHVCCEFPCRSIERRVQSVWYFFEGMNWIATQFPINSLISHLRKTPQSPLSIVLLIDLLPGYQVRILYWHVCSPLLFPPPCLCASVRMCVRSAVSGHLERHQSDSPIPSKRPSSRSETSESPLSSKRPRTAEKSAAEQVRVTNHTILTTLMSSDVHKTLWIRGFMLTVI